MIKKLINKLVKLEVTVYMKSGSKIVVYCKKYNVKIDRSEDKFTEYNFSGVKNLDSIVLVFSEIEAVAAKNIWFWK